MGVSRSMTPTVLPSRGPFAECKPVSPAIWDLGSPSAQAPTYLLLALHTGVARPGLEVDGPPSRGGLFFLLLHMLGGLSSGPTLIDGNVGGYDP